MSLSVLLLIVMMPAKACPPRAGGAWALRKPESVEQPHPETASLHDSQVGWKVGVERLSSTLVGADVG